MAAPVYWTADMVRALPEDGNKYECVYGELLVSPAPRAWHEEIVGRLYRILTEYCERDGLYHVFASRSDISWSANTSGWTSVSSLPIAEARTLTWASMERLELADLPYLFRPI